MSDRTPLIAGNWKMHKTERAARDFVAALLPRLGAGDDVEVAVCAPFTALKALAQAADQSRLGVYAQNMHHADEGPYTGEGVAFQFLSGLSDAVVTHNTIINQNVAAAGVVFDGAPMKRFVMHSNLFQGGPYGVKGSDAG